MMCGCCETFLQCVIGGGELELVGGWNYKFDVSVCAACVV